MAITEKLSTLWIRVMLNMLLADVLSAFVAFTDEGILAMPDNIRMYMAIFAIVINLPIAMIYLSRRLRRAQNRIANIVVGMITIVFVIGGGSTLPHYIVIAAIEVALILTIMAIAWTWQEGEVSAPIA